MTERRGSWRSRWAAIGAAVAVTLGAGGVVAVSVASSVQSSMVTSDPVRILDTRTDVGLAGPFVSVVSQKLQVTGAVPTATGTQTPVPAGATGVLLNVTVVTPTAAGFLSVRPGNQSGAASTSSLNFKAGDIVPNSVQVGLPTAGANADKIDIAYDTYGQSGPTTEVLIDVVGYMAATDTYTRAELDAYAAYSEAQTDAALAGKANTTALPIARSATVSDVNPDPTRANKVLVSVTLNTPVPGIIQVVGSTHVLSSDGGLVVCELSIGAGSTSATGSLQDAVRSLTVPSGERGFCSTNGAVR